MAMGVPPAKITVVLNAPATTLFDPSRFPQRAFMADGRLRLVYAGALTPIYELDVVLRAIAALRERRPELPVELDVFGRGDSEPELVALAATLGIAGAVRFNGRVPLEAIPAAVAAADIGVAPTRRDRFTELSLSTKLFEYAAMGKPVIASRLPTVERYFPPGSVTTYEPGDAGSVADAVVGLVGDPGRREQAVALTAGRLAALSWSAQAASYVALVDRLERPRRTAPDERRD
jgi:glycosyltransferase involved in cell wall biosynthesis